MNFDEYEREKRPTYQRLAEAVQHILLAALGTRTDLRFQAVTSRAKTPVSLRRKLRDRGLSEQKPLESEIKDLAGARIVFYTNSDVSAFEQSGIIQNIFDVVDLKIHHPRRGAQQASELFISNNYTVTLKAERIALHEYADFEGLRCEIQVQTMLNHAWAEMAHDTIYKEPDLDGVGKNAMDAIKKRMERVMREHLLPAGHDFDKISRDFDRLTKGKAILAEEPITAMIEAADNNERYEAIERLTEQVLEIYSGPELAAEYPSLVPSFVAAMEKARNVPSQPIETPFGNYPGKEPNDIAKLIGSFFERHRYLDPQLTFRTLVTLYLGATDDAERGIWRQVGEKLASHELAVWKRYGPAAQLVILDGLDGLSSVERENARDLLVPMLEKVVGCQVGGATWRAESVVIHQGVVTPSYELREVRSRALDALITYLKCMEDDRARQSVLGAMRQASQGPYQGNFSAQLLQIILQDARTVTTAEREIAASSGLELRRWMEVGAANVHWRYRTLREDFAADAALVETQQALLTELVKLRDELDADPEYVLYKTLVGYDSVFPDAWEKEPFDHEALEAWRKDSYPCIINEITPTNAPAWVDRIRLYLAQGARDGATFMALAEFLELLAFSKPAVADVLLDAMDEQLAQFLVPILRGSEKAGRALAMRERVRAWADAGLHLERLAIYLRVPESYDERLLELVSQRAIAARKHDAVIEAVNVAFDQHGTHPGGLVDRVFMPAIEYFEAEKLNRWPQFTWALHRDKTLIAALTRQQAQTVAASIMEVDEIDYYGDQLLTMVARRYPEVVIDFFDARIRAADSDRERGSSFTPVPYTFHHLHEPLGQHPDAILAAARGWYELDHDFYRFRGGRLVLNVFPGFPQEFAERLESIVETGGGEDWKFVVANLANYEGNERIYDVTMKIVDCLEEGDPLLRSISLTLQETGVMRGEFGRVEAYEAQKTRIEKWSADIRPRVSAFAREQARKLDQSIAWEQRRAEQDIEARRREYGEDEGED